MTRHRRKKASDIFREGTPMFAKKVSFEEAFPELEDLRIEVKESGYGVGERTGVRTYTLDNLPGEYIDCSNPHCYGGGFSVGSIVRSMVREGETAFEAGQLCKGYEGSPKGRRKYRDCLNCFEINVSLRYRSKKAEESTG